ncbi:adenylate/guanylate cyclase domain-containing protein [Leptospira sarikeiensis]|nr:adenylate/guanylate cyclase domain-containing protein [Leptospira sarikeiensis]
MHLILWPLIPSNPSEIQYFWYQLPYAIPGLLTFVVGLLLFISGVARAGRPGPKGLFLSFAIACLSFGTLGLLLGLRAIIQDEKLLLLLNTAVYPIVLLFTPMSGHFLHRILEKKYPIIRWMNWLNWGAMLFGFIGILMNKAFTGEFIEYPFGKYPVSTIFLKPWGIIGVGSYFLIGVPCIIHYVRKYSFKEKKTLVFGQNLLIVLTASNLPSFVGVPFFPGGNFSFIPMLILAYGVFRSDFLSLGDFLFRKNALFYFLNALIACVFITMATAVVHLVSQEDLAKIYGSVWLFIPVLSTLAVFWLGIIVGGTNPSSPLNQMAAFSLYIYGAQLISATAIDVISDPIIAYRITQACYVVFFLAPSVHIRFAFLALKRPLPKFFFLFDIAVLVLCIAAFTPWLFVGFYEFAWGRIFSSGPVIQIFGVVGVLGIFAVLKEWISALRTKSVAPLGNFAVTFLLLGSLMLLLNLPATQGFPIYPLGNLSILPTGILAYGVLKNETLSRQKQAFRISHRVSLLSLLLIPFLLFLIFPFLSKEAPLHARILHLLLFGSPILLFGYQLAFFLTRPISAELDDLFHSLEDAKGQEEISRKNAETLSELAKRINSTNDLSEILNFVEDYITQRFGPKAFLALFKVDEVGKELIAHHKVLDFKVENLQKFYALKVPISEEGGTLSRAVQRQKLLYIPKINMSWLSKSPIDEKIVELLGIESFLHIPLIVQGKSLGVLAITWLQDSPLAQKDLKEVSALGDQIAGAVQNAVLLHERTEAVREIEELNGFARILNSTLDLDQVFKAAFDFILNHTSADTIWLLIRNKEKEVLSTYSKGITPKGMSEKEAQFFLNLEVPLNSDGGSLYQTFLEETPLYIDDIGATRNISNELNGQKYFFSKLDIKIAAKGHLRSFLQIPLILNQEVIGIICITAFKRKLGLNKREIDQIVRICEQITSALHNALLYDQIKKLLSETESSREKADTLLLNILPAEVAGELKEKGEVKPILYESATILFTDFKGFTQIAEILSPSSLIEELDGCFSQFDEIVHRYKLEKLKTIGDSYMCVGGIPAKNGTHAIDACLAALELQAFMNQMQAIKKELGLPYWQMRIGIHTGPVIAGVIGKKKFAFDVWGDAVNTASRLESAGEVGKVNISQDTYSLVKDFFKTEYRGTVPVKNKGDMAMHFLLGLKEEFALRDGRVPNEEFKEKYLQLF